MDLQKTAALGFEPSRRQAKAFAENAPAHPELRLLRDCSNVGAWIGRTEIQAGFAVVKDCLAAPHQ